MWLYWVLVRSSQSIILRWNVFDPCELFTTWHRTNFVEVRATKTLSQNCTCCTLGLSIEKLIIEASPSKIDEFQGQNAFLSKKTKTTRIRPVNVCADVGWPKVREFFFRFLADTLSWNHDPGPILDGGHPTNFGICLLVCGQRIRWSLLENMF